MNLDNTWSKLVEAVKSNDERFSEYVVEFIGADDQAIGRLRQELGGKHQKIAFSVLSYLNTDNLLKLFDLLVYFASFTHGSTTYFRHIILKLPKDWVLNNIIELTNSILASGGEDEYRRLLELFFELDKGLARHLAKRAMEQSDPAIKDIGQEFMQYLQVG